METRPRDLQRRTKIFALDVIRLTERLPRNRAADVIGRQLLRSGTSVAANYRSACCAKSAADFVSKMGIVEEEADESQFWLELLTESGLIECDPVAPLTREANELARIAAASRKTARALRRSSIGQSTMDNGQ
jgi:four helix bundle protein